MMMKTKALMGLCPGLVYVGVYDTDTGQALAIADPENIQVDPYRDSNQWKKFSFEITPSEVNAIIKHIKCPFIPLAEINISDVNFMCLRSKMNYLTGKASFDIMENNNETFWKVEEILFALTNRHYSKEQIASADELLLISAILKDEFVVVGLCKADTPSLKVLKEIVEQSPDQPSPSSSRSSVNMRHPRLSANNPSYKLAAGYDSDVSGACQDFDAVFDAKDDNDETGQIQNRPSIRQRPLTSDGIFRFDEVFTSGGEIERRSTKRTKEDRQRIQMNRQTEFSEDWRSATIRSIEALRNIGPFTQDVVTDDDKSPLMEHQATRHENAEYNTEQVELQQTTESNRRQSAPVGARRSSRATMV